MSDGFDETGDASRRTLLASERTLLAWLRTGLTVFAVALGVGRIAPELAGPGATWPYAALGAGYSVLGIGFILYGLQRGREVDRALRLGRWVNLNDRFMQALGALTVILGFATIALIVANA
jgi:uncharacterized membrane protein YidH (DUF202 family)